MPRTKEQQRRYNTTYYAKNRERLIQEACARQAARGEERKAYMKQWYAEHRVEELRKKAEAHRADPEKAREKSQRQYAAHREAIIQRAKAYAATHPAIVLAIGSCYRARKRSAPICDFTAAQWAMLKDAYRHCCAYCGKKSQRLTQDHITPLSEGGSHTLANIVPACKSCNSKKHTGPPPVPVQPLLL